MKILTGVFPLIFLVLLPSAGSAFVCSVSTTSVKFGSYDVFSTSPLDSTGTITISCNNPDKKPIPVTISISSGGSGTFNPRQMRAASGADRLNYYIFIDPARTVIWGDGTGGTSTVTNVVTRDTSFTPTIFGRVPPRQNVRVGNYSDTLAVTVSW